MNEITFSKIDRKTPSLLQILIDKDHYFLHAKNLMLYMDQGLKFKSLFGNNL